MKIDMCSVAPVNCMPKVMSKKDGQNDGHKASTVVAAKNEVSGGNKKI